MPASSSALVPYQEQRLQRRTWRSCDLWPYRGLEKHLITDLKRAHSVGIRASECSSFSKLVGCVLERPLFKGLTLLCVWGDTHAEERTSNVESGFRM